MPVNHLKKITLVKRREQAANLYVQGWKQDEIAKQIGVSQMTISNDIRKIQAMWRESAIRDFDMARELELRKLDRIEKEAWAAWERSQQPLQSAHISDESHARKSRRTVKHQNGNPRYLEIVNRCIGQRCALLGLNISPLEPDTDGITITERRDRILTIVASLDECGGPEAHREGHNPQEPGLLCADSERGEVASGTSHALPG